MGKATIEAESLDSLTNYRLGAMVDERGGGGSLSGSLDRWDDVRSTYDFWAKTSFDRLDRLRGVARRQQTE